jgi:hypothetical protein
MPERTKKRPFVTALCGEKSRQNQEGVIMKKLKWFVVALTLLVWVLPVSGEDGPEKTLGKFKDWGGFIDELEIVEPFQMAGFSKIMIVPLDTAATPLPEKDDNTYEPTTRVLTKVSQIFAEGLKKGVRDKTPVLLGEKDLLPEMSEPGLLIIKGRVTEMNPGSRSKRFWLGFGAGKSRVEIQGMVIDAQTQKELLRFKHARVSGVGTFGGDYADFLTDDTVDVGEDIGKLLLKF